MTDKGLLTEITTALEAWQDEGKDYVVCHSFKGVANEILSKLIKLVEGAGLNREELLDAFGETANEYILNRVQRLEVVAEAMKQAILKAIKEVSK